MRFGGKFLEVDKVLKKILESSSEILNQIGERFPRYLNNLNIDLKELPEPQVAEIGAVDGGNHIIEFLGLDVILVSAAGVYFPINKQHVIVDDFNVLYLTEMYKNSQNLAGFMRDTLEIQQAIKLLDFNPQFIFLDGTLSRLAGPSMPRTVWALLRQEQGASTTDPVEASSITQLHYKTVLKFAEIFHELLVKCRKRDIPIIGIAKDSRVSLLGRSTQSQPSDKNYTISDVVLISEKFRGQTGYVEPFPTLVNPNDVGQVQQQLRYLGYYNYQGEWLDAFYTSYVILKAGHPAFRVEIPSWALDRWEEIITVIHGWHDNNGFIIPAHHTHKEAHIPPDLVNLVTNLLQSTSSSSERGKSLHLMLREKRRTLIG